MDKIVTCINCKGIGSIEQEELTDYHKCEYKTWYEKCPECKGSGRLFEIISYKPFKRPKLDV